MPTAGQTAYEAYMDFSGGVSLVTGFPIPEWDAQYEEIRNAWEAAAAAVIKAHGS